MAIKLTKRIDKDKFKSLYVGNYKGHVKKVKSIFHSMKNSGSQIDLYYANLLLKGDWDRVNHWRSN
jgi:hypothetical protein